MGIIEFHKGCNAQFYCFGPTNDFITIFGTEYFFLGKHFIISLMAGLLVFLGLIYLSKRHVNLQKLLFLFIISTIITIAIFFIAAYFFPVRVIY